MFKLKSLRRGLLPGAFLLLAAAPLSAGRPTAVSVTDFAVRSDNPQFKYLGKGFAEFIGIELAKSSALALIDRERRAEILKEQAFSLSGAAEGEKNLELGRLLAADYFVSGDIFELLGKLTVTIKIVDVASGGIVFKDKITETADKYDYISAALSKSILVYFKADIPGKVAAKIEKPASKPMEAAVRFSEAVNAYDRKDVEGARKELEAARQLDPASEAVGAFLGKLAFNTAKFRVELFKHIALQNPAQLGLLKTDRAFIAGSLPASLNIGGRYIDVDRNTEITEDRGVLKLGYNSPLGRRAGLGVEGFLSREDNNSRSKTTPGGGQPSFNPRFRGGSLSLGYRLSENVSFGFGFSAYECTGGRLVSGTRIINYSDENFYAGEAGILVKNTAGSAVFDSRLAFTDEDTTYSQLDNMFGLGKRYRLPVIMENTLTLTLRPNKTFFVAKGIGYYYTQHKTRTLELIPALEHWFSDSFSGRAGVELKYLKLGANNRFGAGGLLGFTARRGKYDLDVNLEYRVRPSYFLPIKKYDELLVSVSLSFRDLFFRRRR